MRPALEDGKDTLNPRRYFLYLNQKVVGALFFIVIQRRDFHPADKEASMVLL
jgi:hypothetical protein